MSDAVAAHRVDVRRVASSPPPPPTRRPLGNYRSDKYHTRRSRNAGFLGLGSSSGSLGVGLDHHPSRQQHRRHRQYRQRLVELSAIAAAIDQADAGVNANVVFDGSSYHLVLTGDATGTANAFTVSGTGGLAGLSYTPAPPA